MDCGSRFYCNDSIVTVPNGFRVRRYDNKLNYRTHNVLRYPTKYRDSFFFCMMRSTEKVWVRITESEIVAMNDRLGNPKYMHFPLTTPIEKIVCEMLTKRDSLVVLDDDPQSVELPLF